MSLADAELLPQSDTSLPPSQASALLSSFTNFLTVALHSILYHRNLYPQATFLVSRAYNLPVHQSRHPGVCSWIRDAVAAAGAQVRSGAARQIALAIHLPDSFAVAERWIFDLRSFPAAWGADKDKDAGLGDAATGAGAGAGVGADAQVNWTDVNEALRGALSRIANAGQSRPPLPDGCTFTIGVELRDDASPPIEHPQLWIPAQPDLQPPSPDRPELGRAVGGSATIPIRSVHAGPLFFECWVEQGELEPTSIPNPQSTAETSTRAPEASSSSSSSSKS